MYLWDSNILRHYWDGHSTLNAHLERVLFNEIALSSVVVAEAVRGRCEFALKAESAQLPLAHEALLQTLSLLRQFPVIVFDQQMVQTMAKLQQKHRTHKRYADMMIAATALSGNHVVVTRNQKHFADLLPAHLLANWIDDPPR